jgi:S1-C subfamily serine protease
LALLELIGTEEDMQEFFGEGNSLALQLAEELPALQEAVHVVGFPTGGTTICITEGVVSRIDLVSASAFNNLLAIQIDAAINRKFYNRMEASYMVATLFLNLILLMNSWK